jgi:putative transposase
LKNKKSRIPRYKEKNGLVVATYTNQAISKPLINKGILRLSKTEISVKTKVPFERLQQVRIIPRGNHFVIEVLYKTDDVSLLPDNDRYASIDLGVNNLAMIGSNICEPKFISGKPLKSINQFYNKQVAKYKSLLKTINNKKTSKRIKSLSLKRNNRISDYLHKTSRMIINHLVSNQINTLVIGYNSGWKQEINIGRVNNQKFVNIPFLKLINQLEYKAKEAGINTVITNESYTSKCSFLDSEEPKKQKTYKGKRIKRGLFMSSNGKIINADLNGAMNILTKVIGKFNYNPIVACSTPIKLNV